MNESQEIARLRELVEHANHVARLAQGQPDVGLRAQAAGAKAQAEVLLKAAEEQQAAAQSNHFAAAWDKGPDGRPVANPFRRAG